MTIEKAVEILNHKRHRDIVRWDIISIDGKPIADGGAYYDRFDEFEAIAVAEKYRRDAAIRMALKRVAE